MKQTQTITYDGYTIGDKVWVWAYWCRYLAEVEIIGLEIRRELNEADGYISYTVNIEEDGVLQQHTFDGSEFFATRKEALEAAIKQQEVDVSEWQQETQKHKDTLDWLNEQLKKCNEDRKQLDQDMRDPAVFYFC